MISEESERADPPESYEILQGLIIEAAEMGFRIGNDDFQEVQENPFTLDALHEAWRIGRLRGERHRRDRTIARRMSMLRVRKRETEKIDWFHEGF